MPIMANNLWALPGSFLTTPLAQALGRQHTSLKSGSGLRMEFSIRLVRESPVTMAAFLFLVEAVWMLYFI